RSILAFERVLTGYPKSDKVPDAMFKQAKAFLALKDGNSAKILLRKVMSDFPNSNAAKLAAEQLKSLN
ncbi:MAG TPA: tetratricopeptide repeat protein, partial [bacterium]|nr:tetratricopeptide repeat protein [bacterium]